MVRLRIAILGTRGVPARYGGFETFAAELSTRLVSRGHDLSVYCRPSSDDPGALWNGVRRIVLPAVRHKYWETVSHTMLSALDALRRSFDVVLVCNAANAFVLPLLRAARLPVAINVDGIERNRRKWNVAGKAVYSVGESFSALFASRVVADADVIAAYYRDRYAVEPRTIAYGAEFPTESDSEVLQSLGLRSRGYLLYVSRFEPENNPLEVVLAYESLCRRQPKAPPLVMVGEGLYAPALVEELARHRSDRILFPGAVYGRDYRTLQRNAFLYIQATEVGGTHPALIEAMGSGGCVLCHDTPENREVGGGTVGYFSLRPQESLSGTLSEWLQSSDRCEMMRASARARVADRYSWDAVTDEYEGLFLELVV